MSNIPFISVPIAALSCYGFLLLALIAAKKTRLIHSFVLLLLCNILWVSGSLLMRLRIFPGWEFWYDVSLLSLFTVPLVLYMFVHAFVEAKGTFTTRVIGLVTLVMLVLTQRQAFLARPEFILQSDGTAIFRYSMDWRLVFPTVIFGILIGCTGVLIYRVMRRHEMAAMAMPPLFIGMSLLLIGNFMSVLPGNIFPFDTLSGILNAGCLFYALYRKRMFKLTLLVSRGSIFAVSIASMSVLFAFEIQYLEAAIDKYIPLLAPYSTLAIALIFVAFSLSLFALLSRVIDNLFIKDELRQAEKLRQFSVSISKSLNLEEIMGQIISLVSEIVEVEKIYLCLHDESSNRYHVAASASPLDARIFSLSAENPCVTWLREHGSCLLLREFSRTPQYKAMWEQEKRQLAELDASCLVPLSSDDELVGILILTQKYKNSAFTYDDISFLESAQSIVSIAIKNANLYEKAYYESRIDHLTGLLNRKFFYERINEEFGKNSGGSLALVILNLDDFKLYNQLYGNREGDEALQNVANIIRTSLGKQGFAARYGGKEFAIVLPGFDTYKALGLARDIRQQIISMNKQSGAQVLKVLTLSGGVCVYPYAASTVTQLVGNADMAVYNAKRSGKNKILAYSMDAPHTTTDGGEVGSQPGYSDYASTIYALTAAIDAKDHYTFNHSQNVARYATALGAAIGLNEEHIKILNEAALLHDIGKIGIPEQILTKPDPLTDEESRIMQTHVENSISIIRHLPSLDYVIPTAIGHHERWDGTGYPRGISGEDIPLGARCLAIADTFDAMTSNRPYRKALPVETALTEIASMAGSQFDPRLVPVFLDLVRREGFASDHAAPQTVCG